MISCTLFSEYFDRKGTNCDGINYRDAHEELGRLAPSLNSDSTFAYWLIGLKVCRIMIH